MRNFTLARQTDRQTDRQTEVDKAYLPLFLLRLFFIFTMEKGRFFVVRGGEELTL